MDMQKIDMENFKNKKTALVLSGGVIKAASWHLGVALALEELGFTLKNNNTKENIDFEISTYVGSSAGALINLYFASGFRPIDIIEATLSGGKGKSKLKPITYKDMISLKKPIQSPPLAKLYDPLDGLPTLLKKVLSPILKIPGFFTSQGLYDYIQENVIISNNFEDYKADMFVVATQLDHSRKVIFSRYNYPNPRHDDTSVYYTHTPVAESVTASMSVPPFYAPYPIVNEHSNQTEFYIDGEIRETLSTHVATDNSCELIISSWTHTPYHYHDEIGSLVNYGLPSICMQAIYLMIQKKIITSRSRRLASEDILNTVNEYMLSEKFNPKHRKRITSILERKLHYNSNVRMVDIFPTHDNYKVFMRNSFSLDPKKTSEIVSAGYKRTMQIFKNQEWES